jgi:4-amino-4-deoxy-L-arabinose transferase-like glycosyltransferase
VKAWAKQNQTALLIAGLIGLYVLSVLLHLGFLNLRIEESRRALVALEMIQSGNYVQTHTLGWEYYNKPPAFNWVLAGFIKVTGSHSEFLLRLPSFICLLIVGLFHYCISRRYLNKGAAALSVFFTFTSADLYFYTLSNGAEIDVFYSLVVYLQAISMFWFYERKNYILLFVVSWSMCALGFLTKGYTSLAFQFLTLIALAIYARSWKIVFKPQHIIGILSFLLLTGAYYYTYSSYNNPLVPLVNLLKESLQKSAVGSETTGRAYKFLTYPEVLFRVLAPWCLLLFLLFKRPKINFLANPLARFSILFIVLNIGVYWFTGAQKNRYIIMFIPFVMTIISYMCWRFEQQEPGKLDKYLKYTGFLFCLALIGLLVLPFFVSVEWWKILVFGIVLLTFIVFFFRVGQYRLWLCITGFVLLRFIYAAVGIPIKSKGEFNYETLAKDVAAASHFQPVYYWDRPDTLNMNVVIGDTLYKWRDKPVETVPYFIRYQVPYYFYRATGRLMKFDTTMVAGKTYVSYNPYQNNNRIEPVDSFYDKHLDQYLIVFRRKEKPE